MEPSMLINKSQGSDFQNDGLTTPCRIQKRFVPSSSSSKRSLFQDEKEIKKDVNNISDTESDLGPMSPLAVTDQSSCDSSPGRQFISPLVTPEKSPIIPISNWDCLIPGITRNSCETLSPFSSLKKITKSARFSPRRMISFSPKSKSSQLSHICQAASTLRSPNSKHKGKMPDEVVPETPGNESDFDDQQSYVAETPQKEEYSENRLITPLGSVCKSIPIPRIHRRKSVSALEFGECTSPEIKKCCLKRHLDDSSSISNKKYKTTDEFLSVPRARAALFQENDKITNEKEKKFSLNPKSFYGSNDKSEKSAGFGWREPLLDIKKRRSLPSYTSTHRRSLKKHKKGEINCGVGHGIKKPKPKRHSIHATMLKVEKKTEKVNKHGESKENLNPQTTTINNSESGNLFSKESKPNKKFFKFKPGHNAIITVNDKIKLNVAGSQKDAGHINKKAKLDFDAADLSVDEPAVEASLKQNSVNDIIKILENDWADDDDSMETMETMETTHSASTALSPKKCNLMLKDLTMSPASELSCMASSMNIQDISTPFQGDSSSSSSSKKTEFTIQKFYPLFSKGYSLDIADNESNIKKRKRTNAWQLSSKCGSDDNQYQLDAGQKIFGAIQCNECGVMYCLGDPDDENAHLNYHNSFKTLKFQGWKKERIIYSDFLTSSRVILIEPKDSNIYWRKVTDILQIVDRDLGLSDMKLSLYRDKRVYMYIRDKTILGILVAEYVKSAFQMIPELIELNCCTSETTPVKCGINVVWTAMSHRKQGIATKLVDILRASYYYGYIMSNDDLAFSTPTPSGKAFAEKYTKTRNFKVY